MRFTPILTSLIQSDASRNLISKASLINTDEMLPADAANDFGAAGGNYGGFGEDFGGGFMELPQMSDLGVSVDDPKPKGLCVKINLATN